jgi:glycosyltransferase involved in cell wall biosynthesis
VTAPEHASTATSAGEDQHIHLFEPTGSGGIFQHSCDVAQLLTRAGRRVTLHTARQHEPVDIQRVDLCPCVWWPRAGPSRLLRRAAIAARLLADGLPHLHRVAGSGSWVHVEGGVASGALTVMTLWVARRRGRRVVYSPHNTFSRRGPIDRIALGAALGFSDAVVAYSQRDAAVLRSRGPDAFVSPLVQLVPEVPEACRLAWRERWNAQNGERVVLFAGFLRQDKRLDLLIRAARDWPTERRLAVVGEDRGSWEHCRALAATNGVELHADVGFASLDDFTAALAAADLVVAPYERASQSGVLSISRQLGVPTLAADVGGLSELADRTFPAGDVTALAAAIEDALDDEAPPARALDAEAALDAHLAAYAAARRHRGAPSAAGRPRVAIVLWGPSASRADEIAAALGGEGWAFYDLGIVSRRAIPLRYVISALRTIAKLLWRRPESLVVVNPPIFPAVIGLAYARLAGVRIVLDSHPNSFGQKSSVLGRRTLWLTRWLARRMDGTLVGTHELARRVAEWGGRPLIVHEAPPLWDVHPPRTVVGRFRLLWAGIFAPDEPIDEVIEAARLLPDVEFRITGDLRRAPAALDDAPPNVVSLGFLRGKAYHREVQQADAVIALTIDTTSALRAAAESIYHLRPLITSDLPHLRELFPSAVFVENDSAGIAAGVRTVREHAGALQADAANARDRLRIEWNAQRDALARLLDLDEDRHG